jgi:hypothetical protein
LEEEELELGELVGEAVDAVLGKRVLERQKFR